MSNFAKALLIVSVLSCWGIALFTFKSFQAPSFSFAFFLELFGILLLWLTPLSLLILLSFTNWILLAAFFLGILGFLVISHSLYTVSGIVLLFFGFWYWRLRVALSLTNSQTFSPGALLSGISLFLTLLSLFASILYFDYPAAKRASFEPKIPEKLFDAIYDPLSRTLLSELGGSSFSPLGKPSLQEIKRETYNSINTVLKDIASSYARYIPLAFTVGVFLLLKGLLVPFQYLLLGVSALFIKLFLKMGLLHKETVEVPKEIIKF